MRGITLDTHQNRVLTEAYHEARNFGATPREMKALGEALWVESKARNLNYGDRDSRGPLQQRISQGWMHPNNVKLAVRDFLTHARANHEIQGSAGVLAQSVQRSAFPGRYDDAASVANQLLQRYGAYASGGRASLTSPSTSNRLVTTKRIVDDPAAQKRVALANYLSKADPHSLLLRLGAVDPNEPTTKTISEGHVVTDTHYREASTPRKLSNPSAHLQGVSDFEGKKVAAWIKPILVYARAHGWKGQVESGFRTLADQTRIYNSGVRPAAKPGTSNHEFTAFPGGAVDASDPEHLAQILSRSPYHKLLVWAGSKDPVHFSHPHGGSY